MHCEGEVVSDLQGHHTVGLYATVQLTLSLNCNFHFINVHNRLTSSYSRLKQEE